MHEIAHRLTNEIGAVEVPGKMSASINGLPAGRSKVSDFRPLGGVAEISFSGVFGNRVNLRGITVIGRRHHSRFH